MATNLSEQIFPYLFIGLAKYIESEQKYPYPPELLYAQHHLALAMLTSYPTTMTGFLDLCKKPLGEWWPGDTWPAEVDKRLALLTPDGDTDQQVYDYLDTHKFSGELVQRDLKIILESQLMGDIYRSLKEVEKFDPAGAQRDYVAIRSYIMAHPWTTGEKLHRDLRALSPLLIKKVGDLYQESFANSELRYRRSDQPKEYYWHCEVCGPLYHRHGRLGSIKPGACEKRCPEMQGWQPLAMEDHTRVLKRGVHLYTYIPGIVEMRLYYWLMDEILTKKPDLQQVDLWPGVDSCDLLLTWRKRIWAVDVKDYKDPFALGKKITQEDRPFHEDDLPWNEWFYVYPHYRELQRPDYKECVLRMGELPPRVVLLSEKEFTERVLAC